ncbi:thio(seleno)oxazole modification radical SAM maturase SbtM [Desulfogranum mediterraneum]|uniref:thio(seleno)oxazole modification radical SAM maturase SbtM n=1 Tax=Desulfogranum mediterraneum TaxID=160661 RepID=UPI0004016E28|nr:thio(seleno)oxazole modification radical SAM maturase SbtM [Desulfogranum mediterraneum]
MGTRKIDASPFQGELRALEQAIQACEAFPRGRLNAEQGFLLNPSLTLLEMEWTGLAAFRQDPTSRPQPGEELLAVWKAPASDEVVLQKLSQNELLAIKIVHESMDLHQAAREGGVSLGFIDAILLQAVASGILLRAPSRLCRPVASFPASLSMAEGYRSAPTFTLQWHVTQACDLHCKHCYDRSDRTMLKLEQGLRILDDLYRFCQAHNVHGQVSFTGGNPLLYPRFKELYQAAADRGFLLAILGNPTSAAIIDELCTIQVPEFYQVSLEGLAEHNDEIRGVGHFGRVLQFLEILRARAIYAMVMLTLTQGNRDQVLPLAELLRDKVDLFVFNRLTLFGEGASLQPVEVESYDAFLADYEQAASRNPVMALKDNILNRRRQLNHEALFGGCAGFGCGAAFNFVSLLPDGEVHACRKFPSLIGNIFQHSLAEIYHSPLAERYRRGSEACGDCRLKLVCRGCPAVVAGHGLDPFVDRDPYCPSSLDQE